MKYDHHSYCEILSEALLPIRGFLMSDSEEDPAEINKRLKAAKYPVLVSVAEDEYDFTLTESETLNSERTYVILILDKAEKGQLDMIRDVKKNCTAYAQQICAKLLLDHTGDRAGLTGLVPDSISLSPAGPFGDFLYGMLIRFTLKDWESYELNENMWR